MRAAWHKQLTALLVLPAALLLNAPERAQAEQLPLKSYRALDGLPHEIMQRIVRDSRGFLWFCTALGPARFDGYRFTVYGKENGLTYKYTNALIETRAGDYWVGTNGGGVYLFHPGAPGGSNFKSYPVGENQASNRVNELFEDRAGRIWAGTDAGLFRLEAGGKEFLPVALGLPSHPDNEVQILAFVEDGEGSIWIGRAFGLSRILPDGRILHYSVQPTSYSGDTVIALMLDGEGRLWLGHSLCTIVFKPQPISAAKPIERFPWLTLSCFGGPNGSATLPATAGEACRYEIAGRAFCRTGDGHVWVGSEDHGLIEFNGERFRSYTTANGLSKNQVNALAEDIEGNLWISCKNSCAMRLSRSGFVTYTEADGLGSEDIGSIFEGRSGELYTTTGKWRVNRLDGDRFTSVRLNLPRKFSDVLWRYIRSTIQDREGEWWVATGEGLYRFPKTERVEQLARALPKAVYTARDGLVSNGVTKLFEDSRGDIWITAFAPGHEIMARWERATGRFHRYTDKDGLQPFNAARSFCEDAAGRVWIGFREGGCARYDSGRFTLFGTSDGLPASGISDFHIDRVGRLWIASSGYGLIRCDNPLADQPRFAAVLKKEGLSEIFLNLLVEDAEGRIYFCAPQNISRFDPATGQIKQYTTAEELTATSLSATFRDRQGRLWFGTNNGLSRLIPQPDQPKKPPSVFINGLRIAGRSYPVADLGQNEIGYLELEPSQNQIQIDFFSLSFSLGESLRYQYKIEGAGQDWSAPTEQRTVNISLGPGSYRFLVRAALADGALSESSAGISFRILPPVWQRWWFLMLAALVLAIPAMPAVYYRRQRIRTEREAEEALRRSREERLAELERVRRRIAIDLHDDIGSSLTRISLLSEVSRRKLDGGEAPMKEPLSLIARLSREVVDSMSEIVWAINPAKDHLSDLSQRMRHFASDLFTSRQIDFRFRAPDLNRDLKVGANVRREVFLIFKEAVNNAVRHSECTQAEIEFLAEDDHLILTLKDNGKGFDVLKKSEGHGLQSMRERTSGLGGSLEIASENGRGAVLKFRIPLKHQEQNLD